MAVEVCIMVLDTLVIPNYYTYMMHINYMQYSPEEMKTRFLETMKHFKFHKWIAVEERGKEKKLLHLQCCLWHSSADLPRSNIIDYRFTKQRRYKSGKNAKRLTCQVSFAPGKKKTLSSYSTKDITNTAFVITNLTKKERKLIPNWIKLEDKEKKFIKARTTFLETLAINEDIQDPIKFVHRVCEFHREHNKNTPSQFIMSNWLFRYLPDHYDVVQHSQVCYSNIIRTTIL